ncbi:uncharacterized protein MONBRDRAFT_32747 [Monosiga brevicollis MX1]|uniref:Mitochondrial import receptor subunit TOM22 homolog n=1 Tax=Monosiga brevicollis TaxID=81824 RepID=A9V1G1_MONBE|nr:uncharacterized protein MONBRDRAFT_32747 [Monosiga brevicollis MX1]EDQ88434.1 predicted protein [Monosiga brevicollis MX1]|eukprot:XP_001746538.1 hypothetical protein [Monosiga brevicollis MX1]
MSVVQGNPAKEELFETVFERIAGLSEMFPESVRNAADRVSSLATTAVGTTFNLGGKFVWVVATSALVMFVPVVYEADQAPLRSKSNQGSPCVMTLQDQYQEQMRQQQQQIMMGKAPMGGPNYQGPAVPDIVPIQITYVARYSS